MYGLILFLCIFPFFFTHKFLIFVMSCFFSSLFASSVIASSPSPKQIMSMFSFSIVFGKNVMKGPPINVSISGNFSLISLFNLK